MPDDTALERYFEALMAELNQEARRRCWDASDGELRKPSTGPQLSGPEPTLGMRWLFSATAQPSRRERAIADLCLQREMLGLIDQFLGAADLSAAAR